MYNKVRLTDTDTTDKLYYLWSDLTKKTIIIAKTVCGTANDMFS